MNKKIASEIAVGMILILAVLIGAIFWLKNQKEMQASKQLTQNSNLELATTQQQTQQSSQAQSVAAERSQPSGQIPKSYSDENVDWLPAPVEVTDVQLFKKNSDNTQYKVWETGTVKSGEFADSRILLVVVDSDDLGPAGPAIFRFVQKKEDGQLYFLKDYSNMDFFSTFTDDNSSWQDVNKKLFSYMDQDTYDLNITSLEYPGTLFGPNGQQLKKEDDYPFNDTYDGGDKTPDTYYGGVFLDTDQLKFAFTDSVYGDVYTTDISKVSDANKDDIYSENGFYVKAPDGTFKTYSAVIDLGGDVPNVTWNDGSVNKSSYTYRGESGCGSSAYADILPNVTDSDLMVLGKTAAGDNVYGFADKNNKILTDYYNADHALTDGTNDDDMFANKEFNSKTSYDDFLNSYPMFFWKDSFGRLVRFTNENFIPEAGCGKPVIYLYPQQTENVSVQVTPTAGMTASIPAYDGGWNVVADPQSNIFNLEDNKTYPYLFWEGSGDSIYHMPQQGFVVAQENLGSFFDTKLSEEGLIPKEINDFKDFWIPRMLQENKPYYFVTFVNRATIDKLAPLDISPEPDTTIRVLMDYKGLDNPITVQGFNIKTPQRNGFTAVEWGGVLR